MVYFVLYMEGCVVERGASLDHNAPVVVIAALTRSITLIAGVYLTFVPYLFISET